MSKHLNVLIYKRNYSDISNFSTEIFIIEMN